MLQWTKLRQNQLAKVPLSKFECDKQADEDVLSCTPEEPSKTMEVCEASTGRRNEIEVETTGQEVAIATADEEGNERVES